MKVTASPLIAHWSDETGRRRELMIACALLATVAFSAFAFVQGFFLAAVVTACAYLFLPAILPLNEQLTLAAVRAGKVDYGRTRSVGSVTFMAGTIGGGIIIAWSSLESVYWMAVFALLATWLASMATPKSVRPQQQRAMASFSLKPVWGLLTMPGMALFLLAVGLIQSSHGVYYVVGTLHWKASGIDTPTIGLLWAVGVIMEVLLFLFAGKWLKRWGVITTLTLTACCGTIRWFGTALTTELWILFALQALHGFTYGLTHLATMAHLAKVVPEHRAATAQALYNALPMGIMNGMTLVVTGVLYAYFDGFAYWAMMALTILALWPLALLRRQTA